MQYSVEVFINLYGSGEGLPTTTQWETLLKGDMNSPLTVVNFFKLKDRADTTLTNGKEMTGSEAFATYAETSVPKVSEVGGHFLLRGTVEGNLIGNDSTQWDIIAIGQYPQREYFLKLFKDDEYQKAFKFRRAALEKQNVFLINAM
ncbi:DUF1330 domain-containing protein [Mastigocoleus testarum]|uniref:DUF1330 domain-containing protein n=1 Tax=Mastigocoleus testarum BC008 TaxID=371196 RepID=A0A0V7ZS64_9CYAN|nr:DUF1330 domain-containing protein [Mastigocoleus testarum]KST67459.1 hypothetical protein BC008_30130 [Mastigocoleus testarum BC008]